MDKFPLVAIRSFIEATRDSGYKNTSSAIAELIDNAFEADAKSVDIVLSEDGDGKRVMVTDDGTGMPAGVLQLALQFGGSTRFNSRRGTGRYGMGLPNGSLSQARRVDVYSWMRPNKVWASYLDVDEIASGELDEVPSPVRIKLGKGDLPETPSGTSVVLTKCDRLTYRTVRAQAKRLQADVGRIFRHQLYAGRSVRINGEAAVPFDPTFLRAGSNLLGAAPYGPPLIYEVLPPSSKTAKKSRITVTFSVLPIEKWHDLPNDEKNAAGISKCAGVSVIRAGREVDYGWYFMGSKRKENYDDWWRCEVAFSPDLDELFGVTHTKQKINPTEALNAILASDLERVARSLNGDVRKRYLAVRGNEKTLRSQAVAEERDHLMQPLTLRVASTSAKIRKNGSRLNYAIEESVTDGLSFYTPTLVGNRLKVVLNREHSFYNKIYQPLLNLPGVEGRLALQHMQLMLMALGRAECALKSREEKETVQKLRDGWSNVLTAFLD